MSDHDEPVRRAFVFGGGGVLGFAWMVGALTAIQYELGVEPGPEDLVVGTSAGSVVAGLLGRGVDVDTIRRHQMGMPLPGDPSISWNYEADTGAACPADRGCGPARRDWCGAAFAGPRRFLRWVPCPDCSREDVAACSRWPACSKPSWRAAGVSRGLRDAPGSWPPIIRPVAGSSSDGRGGPSATLPEAVCSSCAIPAWYAPVHIEARSYIDGGTASNASVDLIPKDEFEEVYVLAPMAALRPDSPRSPVAMVERRVRRAITKGIADDVAVLRQAGARVTLLTPGRDDLSVMGANLMNPNRRTAVLHTAMRTAAVELPKQRRAVHRRSATTATAP